MYDSELRDRMLAVGYTQREAAYDLGVTEATMRNKLRGRTEFRRGELRLLEIILAEKEEQKHK
jgi:predicted transcriptional regulator